MFDGAALAAVLDYYRARIEAVRHGASPGEIVLAMRAILNEQTLAVRAIVSEAKTGPPIKAAQQSGPT